MPGPCGRQKGYEAICRAALRGWPRCGARLAHAAARLQVSINFPVPIDFVVLAQLCAKPEPHLRHFFVNLRFQLSLWKPKNVEYVDSLLRHDRTLLINFDQPRSSSLISPPTRFPRFDFRRTQTRPALPLHRGIRTPTYTRSRKERRARRWLNLSTAPPCWMFVLARTTMSSTRRAWTGM
jgi:hypothetical protein